ncbi:NUDIX hydrolase [Maritimibacter sp. UBA3975]|uniref:NUDIX hydrolase n=1 Tax=Maritimibacter sp. UBA3975 TaxID=1946833 RepID=UPI000C0B4F5F|nr:NUDIX hydrolase [Maritimibacter sp. UBA3975]MAM63420.1 NUDIX hydrolase [Maritimibacter sp.]|tara:strand:- start:58531 stop:58980 length:450 start_codon:yes stop_codon:yes gene_type:complete
MRRYGETIVKGQRYRPRPGAYAILPRDGRVLLTFQDTPEPEFQLPGGGIDPGESPLRALHREVVEETGWRISAPRRIGAFRRFAFMPEYDLWAEKICHIYVALPVRPLHPPTEPGHEAVWVGADQAIELLDNAGDRAFLTSYVGAFGPR